MPLQSLEEVRSSRLGDEHGVPGLQIGIIRTCEHRFDRRARPLEQRREGLRRWQEEIRVIEFACDFLVKLHGDAHATRFRVHYRARLIAITPAAAGQDTR